MAYYTPLLPLALMLLTGLYRSVRSGRPTPALVVVVWAARRSDNRLTHCR